MSNAQPPQREQANANRTRNHPQLAESSPGLSLEHSAALRIGVGAVAAMCLIAALVSKNSASISPSKESRVSNSVVAVASEAPVLPGSSVVFGVADVNGAEPTTDGHCSLSVRSLASGDTGDSVTCLQQALAAAGFLGGAQRGVYDGATVAAVRQLQTDRNLFVDGRTGRETALSLGVWPDETSVVIHTPTPAPGSKDSLGYELSSVATSGTDAPPLPPNSGSGRRLVYDRAGQRVWAISDDEAVIRSWLVSGSLYNNETPGAHAVYSRSILSTAWNGKAYLNKMVRWLKTDIGAIGFHAIPIHVADNTAYQTDAELGTRLSGGCQRQANLDAAFTWDFAVVGTPVIVI